MKYYVYVHRRKDNNEIFYVGKGTGSRYKTVKGRNKKWNKIYNEVGAFFIILEYFNTEREAEIKEQELLDSLQNLVNVKIKSNETLDYNSVNWKEIVEYSETSPTGLRYIVDPPVRNPKYKKNKGDVAGYLRKIKDKFVHGQIEVKGKSYAVHRVVWLLHNGTLDKDSVVNHIDCDPSNNKIENLEICTKSENNNRKKITKGIPNSNSNSGIPNIFFCSRDGKTKIRVSFTSFGKRYTKQFCTVRFGFDEAMNLAKEYLKSAKEN